MAAGSGSILALAARLRALEDDSLADLVAARGVRSAGIRDFFDLAEALLDRTSIQEALQRLDRPTLALIAVAGELAATASAPTAEQLANRLGATVADTRDRIAVAVDAALLGSESGRYAPWDTVVEQLQSWPSFGLPSLEQLVTSRAPKAAEPVTEADARFVDRGAGDRAFSTVTAVTELVLSLREHPARRLARGGIALPDLRRLATAAGIETDDVESLLDVATLASVAAIQGGEWVATERARGWLASSRVERWGALVEGWLERLPEDLRGLLRGRAGTTWGVRLLDELRWLYPAGGDWVGDRAGDAIRVAELLGVLGGSAPSTPGAALLVSGPDAAADGMAALFPAEVDRVYVQHDLTVIAPGPLRADLDIRVRGLAEVEARGVASTFRITALALDRALLSGETVEGIREFLAGISLTGIPQPLDYLLAETAARFGSLRVGELPLLEDGARSYVRSDDAALLGQLAVDQALAPLSLTRTGEHRLVSRFDAGLLYSSLLEARYPVVAEDEAGRIVRVRVEQRVVGDTTVPDDGAALLVARVRAGAAQAPEETGRAWLARQLELAIKGRVTVSVSVRLPDDSLAEYLLEPASLAGGRLRARDRRADIERTLPLSSIVSVTSPS